VSSIQDYFTQAQFALAAYANLSIGEIAGANNAALQQAKLQGSNFRGQSELFSAN
jgi:uncharacterized protein YjbI with pentapeptide repeats